ncbi:MAG: hypothetical protein H0X42_05965 [Solirubrobacterales bacterium]|nr:hypothetical protein [Solirubrobacterales bacterium]
MDARTMRLVGGGVVIVVAIVLLVVLKNGNSDSSKTTDAGKAPTIVVSKAGKPVGGIADLTYNEGDRIQFKVHSAVADEVHVHGYDLMKDVKAGGTIAYDFPATIEGVFEAELEGRKEQIIQLTVDP